MIIAIDFDGTICSNCYPQIGEPNLKLIHYLQMQKSRGHTLILWTCRQGILLDNAIRFCNRYGLTFDYVNENSLAAIERYGTDSRKVFADIYIDDKGIKPDEVEQCMPNAKTDGLTRQKMTRLKTRHNT